MDAFSAESGGSGVAQAVLQSGADVTHLPAPRAEAETLAGVLRELLLHPVHSVLLRWNWKAAVLSTIVRGTIFFTVNLAAGREAAVAAAVSDMMFRATAAGLLAAVTQAFRRARPPWAADLAAMVLLPALNHCCEFAWHWLRGTALLHRSVLVSVGFTVISTLFNLYIMRRGVWLTGPEQQSVWSDLAQMPRLMLAFVAAGPLWLWRRVRGARAGQPPASQKEGRK